MKASKLIDFLISLGTDPEVLRRFQQDREAAMNAAGLSAEEKALLAKGDQHKLRAAILAASAGAIQASDPKPKPTQPGPQPGYMDVPTGPKPGPKPPGQPQPGYMDVPIAPQQPGYGYMTPPGPPPGYMTPPPPKPGEQPAPAEQPSPKPDEPSKPK